MAAAIHRTLSRSLPWIGVGLVSLALEGCSSSWRQRLGIEPEPQAPTSVPEVSDGPRAAPLQPGRNVIVQAVERVGPSVVRIDTVKRISNPLGNLFGGGPAHRNRPVRDQDSSQGLMA